MLTRLFIAALALPAIAAAIELKPEYVETDIEQGIKVSEVILPDGPKQIVYAYPAGWRPSLGASDLSFAHPTFLHTNVSIRIAKTATLDDEEIKVRTEWLSTLAPKGSTDFTVEKAQRSDLVISKAPVLDLAANYSAFGQKYRAEVFVIYAATGTMEFVVISPAPTFEKALETIRQSLFSLRWEKRDGSKGTAAK
jgi:hypothetical protein